jgi:hypothetical protein
VKKVRPLFLVFCFSNKKQNMEEHEKVFRQNHYLIKFLNARDALLTTSKGSFLSFNLVNALLVFRECQDYCPEAAYIINAIVPHQQHNECFSAPKLKSILLEYDSSNPIALCYAALIDAIDRNLLQKAAELGHPYAMLQWAMYQGAEHRLHYLKLAANAGDRDALHNIGVLMRARVIESFNVSIAECYLQAAYLGQTSAMYYLLHDYPDVEKCYWVGKCATISRNSFYVLRFFDAALDAKNDTASLRLFIVGQVFNNQNLSEIAYTDDLLPEVVKLERKSVAFYNATLKRKQAATLSWMSCAKVLGIHKDVAKLVGMLVFESVVPFI